MLELSFARVEDIAAARHHVPDAKRKTLRARLQQLQRIGLPQGVNVGKGGRARYGTVQLAQVLIALDLLDVGMPPERVAALVLGRWNEIRKAFAFTLSQDEERVCLVVFPRALGHLSDDATERDLEQVLTPMTGKEVAAWIGSEYGLDRPVAIVDLLTLYRALVQSLLSADDPSGGSVDAVFGEILGWGQHGDDN